MICISVVCCKSTRHFTGTGDVIAGAMLSLYFGSFTVEQFDSICRSDNLEGQLSKWYAFSMIDYEDKDTVFQYIYMKSLSVNMEALYTVTPKDGKFLIRKSIIDHSEND